MDHFGHHRRPRVEDRRLLTGLGRFTDDIGAERPLHMVMLRSAHAHAAIHGIDTTTAAAMPGVRAIVTGADVLAAGLGAIPCVSLPRGADGRLHQVIEPPQLLLATDRVRHVGEAIAAVVAETAAQARDAAEAILLDEEPLPAVTDTAAALAPDAPQLWPQAPGNLCYTFDIGDEAAVAAAMSAAHHVTRITVVNQRISANPIEPRAALGQWDPSSRRYHLTAPLQTPHQIRNILATRVLKIPERDLRVTSPDVGGGFGMKGVLFREYGLVLWLARRLGRPVRWTATRSESLLADEHARDNVTDGVLALDRDGRFLALSVQTIAAIGAQVGFRGAHSPVNNLGSLAGVYTTPAIHARVRAVFTNTAPTAPYRGAGRPEATYLLERLIDRAAGELGIDRIDLRRRNLIPASAMPYRTGLLFTYDTGDFAAGMDMALTAADWAGFPARRAESAACGKRRGIALINAIEQAGGPIGTPLEERADIRFDAEGGVTLLVGTNSNGQGHETIFAQMLADRLGMDRDQVRVVQGDTDLVPFGRGTFGSRSAAAAGSSIAIGADRVIAKGRAIAAHLLEAAEADIDFDAGRFAIAGTDRGLSLTDVLRASLTPGRLPPGMEAGLDEAVAHATAAPTYPNGAHVCEVEVDPETGQVAILRYLVADDVGTVVDHTMLAGQVHGGVAQGIGQALGEHLLYDPEGGQNLTASFMDYAIPRAADLPAFEMLDNPHPSTANRLGVKGGGEAGTIGAPPAIINAILDALGVGELDMPATPARIWSALNPAARSAAG